MNKPAPKIRKVDSPAAADFDDQLWPINVAILILAGFVVGIVIALSDFQDPRIFYNGWTHLGIVALLVGGLFWAFHALQGRVLRRIQLCVLISLIIHLWLAMYLHEQFLALLLDREEQDTREVTEQFERITIPDYNWQQIDRPEVQETFDEPLETEAPEPQQPEAVKRETDDPKLPVEPKAIEEPEPLERQQPDEAVARRRELTAPRRADQAAGAQVSRQEWKHRPRPNEPIPEPELKPEPRRAAALPTSEIAPRQRETTPVEVDQRQTFEDLASPEPSELEVQMARRAPPTESPAKTPSTPAPSREIRRPAEVPQTLAAAPQPTPAARRSQQSTPVAAEQMAARREAASPQLVRPATQAESAPTAPNAIAQAAARQRQTDSMPQPSRATRPAPHRQPREVRSPTDVARPEAQAMASSVPQSRQSPDVAQLAAQVRPSMPSTNPSQLRVNQQAASVTAQPGPSAVVENPMRRASTPAEPAAEPVARARGQRTRARPSPQIAAAPVAPASVASTTPPSSSNNVAAARPAAAAVSRTAEPSADEAAQQPAGRAIPTMTDVAQLPAEAAPRRANAQQQGVREANSAPSRPASLARSNQGANLPSTMIPSQAEPVMAAAAAGSSAPSRVAQTGPSAAVRRAGGRPTPTPQGPAAGSAELAVGSSTAVARAGQPRAEGMGRPSAAATDSRPRIARTAGPVSSTVASGVPQASPATPGAVASTASGPTTPSFNLRSSAASRGGTIRQLAAQPTVGSGPPGPSGTPGPIGASHQSRVTRHESLESAVAGGGTPRPGRTVGGAASPSAMAAPSAVAGASAPSGGRANEAPPLEAPVSGPRRQIAGLPGSIESQPSAGALASMTTQGEPVVRGVARRGGSPSRAAGDPAVAASRDMTRRRTALGLEIPTIAEASEPAAQTGMAGVALAEGGLPSKLPQGSAAAVRTAAADLPTGDATQAAGAADEGLGSAAAVALAGRARAAGDEVPNLTAATEARQPTRQPAAGMQVGAAPAEALAGGPTSSAETAERGPAAAAVAGIAARAVAQGAGGVPEARPSEDTVAAAAPNGGAIAAGANNRASRSDRLMAAAASGSTAGPRRMPGAIQTVGSRADAAQMAQAAPTASGGEAGLEAAPLANLAGTERLPSGQTGPLVDQPAVEGATQRGPTASTPGIVAGARRLPTGRETEPAIAAAVGRGPLRRTTAPGLPRGTAEAVAEQPIASASTPDSGDAIEVAQGMGRGEPSRQEGGLPVQIAAAPGPGGLGFEPSPDVGLPSRRARPESDIIHTVSRRFVIERSGGRLAIDGRVRAEPAEAFSNRDRGRRAQVAQQLGGTSGTEYAVEVGLDFFARHQFPDGHWSLHDLPEGVEYDDPGLGEMKSDTAATGLALLTYLGAGYTHLDDKHRAVVDKGVDWLAKHQKPNGDLFAMADGSPPSKYAWFYSHGIAAIALCEAYGMTHDPELREPATKAIEFIVNSQNPTRGGWRYTVDEKGRATETDTSVTGWQLMALKSAQMAGIEVPEESLEKIGKWLDSAQAPRSANRGQYVYNPHAQDTEQQRHGRDPNLAMTAEAMLMRMYLGADRDDPMLIAGADYLKQNLPAVGTLSQSKRDVYYWYYATQAMFQMHGDYWTAWNDSLRPLTLAGQEQTGELAGSWNPKTPVRDRWGHAGGRMYVTAMHLLMLEVYYRHLPLFQELRK